MFLYSLIQTVFDHLLNFPSTPEDFPDYISLQHTRNRQTSQSNSKQTHLSLHNPYITQPTNPSLYTNCTEYRSRSGEKALTVVMLYRTSQVLIARSLQARNPEVAGGSAGARVRFCTTQSTGVKHRLTPNVRRSRSLRNSGGRGTLSEGVGESAGARVRFMEPAHSKFFNSLW